MQTQEVPNPLSRVSRAPQDIYRVGPAKILNLNPDEYPGGIAAWGALNPVFDTTQIVPETGVHIHARKVCGGLKSIDETFDTVRVEVGTNRKGGTFEIYGDDATHYNIAAIFKLPMTYLRCPDCGEVHSDSGYDAVHLHRDHNCKCGKDFTSPTPCISNRVMLLKELCGDILQDRKVNDPVDRRLINFQSRKKGEKAVAVRYQIWGSNPAVLWLNPKMEEGGIHVHMFLNEPLSSTDEPTVDQTYGQVKIDGINLDPEQIRYLMAQQGLDYLSPYVHSLNCPSCSKAHFDRFEKAVTPHAHHTCEHCGVRFPSPEAAPWVVSNPAAAAVCRLYQNWQALANEPRICYTE